MRAFSFNPEVWGQAPCAVCAAMDDYAVLCDEEERLLEARGLEGPDAARAIIVEKLGVNACGDHVRPLLDPVEWARWRARRLDASNGAS